MPLLNVTLCISVQAHDWEARRKLYPNWTIVKCMAFEECFGCFSTVACRLASPMLVTVSNQLDFDLPSSLQEQIDQRAQVDELGRSILSDLLSKAIKQVLLDGLEVDKARPPRRRKCDEESVNEVVLVPTREDGELESSEDDKLVATSAKNFAIACPQLRLVKRSWPVQAALATLQKWRASNSSR